MKAVVYTKYGPPEVLSIDDIQEPTPKDNEVLIKVHATTMNRTDCGFRSAQYFITRLITGLTKPKNPVTGTEFAGEVVEVGKDVKNFKIGDKVFGFDDSRFSAHAEFKTEPANGPIAKIPKGWAYDKVAAAGEGATYVLNYIKAARIEKGQRVLVYGASGAIGSAGVQLIKSLGVEVVAVCGTKNLKAVKELGADRVIDYQKEDFTQTEGKFDLVFDAVGKSSYGAIKHMLKPTGKYCSSELGPGGQNPFLALWFLMTGSRRVLFPIPKINQENMTHISKLLEAGTYKPLIDRTYKFEDIVEATKYVETGQKTGNVVIRVV